MTTGNGAHDPRVASLEEARRRKAEQDKAAARKAAPASRGGFGPRALGLIMIAMAVGFCVWLAGGLGDAPALPGQKL